MNPNSGTKHIFVAHGDRPVPPKGWGAVEWIIWQTATRLKSRGIEAHIVNKPTTLAVIEVLGQLSPTKRNVVYCHAEKPVKILSKLAKRHKFHLIATTHDPLNTDHLSASNLKAIRRISQAPFHFVGREDIKPLILAQNPNAKCAIQFNPVETKEFRTTPHGNGRAICLGRIQERKRQNDTALLLKDTGIECDFVGPLLEKVEISDELRRRMLGEWDRETIHSKLCKYSCLILLSKSERQPLVVLEALAAGIPVVVSRYAAWNLDPTKPYIFLVESDSQVVAAVRESIAIRDQTTNEIRKYAEETFDYEILVDNYLAQVAEWLANEKVN